MKEELATKNDLKMLEIATKNEFKVMEQRLTIKMGSMITAAVVLIVTLLKTL